MEEIKNEEDFQKKLMKFPPDKRDEAEKIFRSGRKLRALGFWNGKHTFPGLPDPKIFQDDTWDPEEKSMVITYLKKFPPIIGFMGLSYCRFDCGKIDMGACEMTDGVYCWPEGLPHYLENHAVRLPGEFVEHVRNNINVPIPFKEFAPEAQLLWFFTADYSWWRSRTGWD